MGMPTTARPRRWTANGLSRKHGPIEVCRWRQEAFQKSGCKRGACKTLNLFRHSPSDPMTEPPPTPTTVEELLDYWPGNIPFKGSLVSDDGLCMCAQGQALHYVGNYSVSDLRAMDQRVADQKVAKLFGISRAHSVLLRIVNDKQQGAPSCIIRNPEQILGDQAQAVLAFWRHLDRMTPLAWEAHWAAARGAHWEAAGEAAREAAGEAHWEAASKAAREAADALAAWASAGASNEIQGSAGMRARSQPFWFLPLFGFADPEAVMAADSEALAGAQVKP